METRQVQNKQLAATCTSVGQFTPADRAAFAAPCMATGWRSIVAMAAATHI